MKQHPILGATAAFVVAASAGGMTASADPIVINFSTGPVNTTGDNYAALAAANGRQATATLDVAEELGTLTVTLTANTGALRNDGSALGVDAPGTDTNDRVDPTESIEFSFNQEVRISAFTFYQLATTEEFEMVIGTDPAIKRTNGTVTTSGSVNTFTPTQVVLLSEDKSMRIANTGTAGDFGIISFTVEVIPEPATLGLLGAGGLLMIGRRRSGTQH